MILVRSRIGTFTSDVLWMFIFILIDFLLTSASYQFSTGSCPEPKVSIFPHSTLSQIFGQFFLVQVSIIIAMVAFSIAISHKFLINWTKPETVLSRKFATLLHFIYAYAAPFLLPLCGGIIIRLYLVRKKNR
jgi:hypothetical protein